MVSSVIVSILETQFSLCNTSWCNTMALSEKCYLDEGNVSYSPSDIIGRGGFGVVYRGFIDVKNFKDQSVAIKKINLSCYDDEKARDTEPMVNLRHENFINIVKVLTDDEYRYLVMEMCVGTLAQVIDGSYKGPTLPSDVLVLRDIANGLYYIHTEKLVHRNIKPGNILISKDGRMKISDLSYADSATSDSCCWMAQELLVRLMIARSFGTENTKNIKLKATPSCDIFSAGCLFFVFLTRGIGGVHPFGDDNIERLSNIVKGDPVNIEKLDFNHYARATIDKMVARSPRDRSSLSDVLKMLEKAESTELDHSELENQSHSLPRDASISTIEKDNNEELLAMNEELDPLENVEVKLENSELECDHGARSLKNADHLEGIPESSVETLATRQTIIGEHSYCMKDEPVVTQNLINGKAENEEFAHLDPNKPQNALLVDAQSEIKREIEEPNHLNIEELSKENLISFRQYAFYSTSAKRIDFHPIHHDLLCCDSPEGVMAFQQHSTGSLMSCDSTVIEKPHDSLMLGTSSAANERESKYSKRYVKWNIDGTKLAAAYSNGLIAIWEYPCCEINYCRNLHPLKCKYNSKVVWNPCYPHVFATYKWSTQSVFLVWLFGKKYSEFEIPIMKDPDTYIYQPEVKTVEWISKDRIVISYETGCLRLYYADGSKPPTFLKQYENGVGEIVRNMSWNEKHQLLATGGYNNHLMVWKMDKCTPSYTFIAKSRCLSVAWQPNNEKREKIDAALVSSVETESSYPTLACGLDDGTVLLWVSFDIRKQPDPIRLEPPHVGKVEPLLFSPDGNYLAAISYHKKLYVWHTKSWTIIEKIPGRCREASWNASSNKLAIVTNQSEEKIPECQLELLEIELNHTSGV